jgi:hypothetical protein
VSDVVHPPLLAGISAGGRPPIGRPHQAGVSLSKPQYDTGSYRCQGR